MENLSPALLITKTRIPRPRRGLVHRKALVQRLSREQDHALTIVRAPAGYGKSTLLQQWALDDARRFAWVQFDPPDSDPILFWRYILAALRVQVPGLAESAWRRLATPAPDLDAVVTDLLNELMDVPEGLVLVLDDYHVVDHPECHRTIMFFIEHVAHNTQVVLATRAQFPFSVSRLIARGLVTELGYHDLEFTPTETAAVVRLRAPAASDETVSRIRERTEGWPVGVYLATWHLDTPAGFAYEEPETGTITQRYVADEMLSDLDAEDRVFIQETSILNRLSGDLCDHVTGRTDSREILARLESANLLLIPLDDVGDWYRYHHLLQEILQTDLRNDPSASEATLHVRASNWFLRHDEASQSILHAIESGQLAMAGDLICAHWQEHVFTGRLETVRRWLGRFPTDTVLEHPPLIVASAWIAAFSGEVDETIRLARAAERTSFSGDTPDGAASHESSVALLLAALALDGVTDALMHAEIAYRLEPSASPWKPMAAVITGTARAALGESEDAREALLEASHTPAGPDGLTSYAMGQLALLETSEGHWEAASRYASRGRDLITEFELQNLVTSGAVYTASAAVEVHRGNTTEARRQLQSLSPVLARLSDAFPFDAFQTHLVAGETYFAIGDPEASRVHARAAAGALGSLGDGGIFADRLRLLQNELATTDRGSSLQPTPNTDPLTAREVQILILLTSSMSLRDIGQELYVSRNTVKTHVSRVYRKLGVSTRTAAIARGRELELI